MPDWIVSEWAKTIIRQNQRMKQMFDLFPARRVQNLQPFTGDDDGIIAPPSAGSFPFELYVAGGTGASVWRTFEVRTGEIWPPYQTDFQSADNDDAAVTPLAIVVPASTTKYKIWLEMTLGGGFFSAITINSGASGWTGYPSLADTTKWYWLIGEISTSADNIRTYTLFQRQMDTLILQAPVFPVTVTQTGGSAGSSSAFCSFTYTVRDLLGTTIGTSKSPTLSPARIFKCVGIAGTGGTAYYDTAGVLQLASINETVTTKTQKTITGVSWDSTNGILKDTYQTLVTADVSTTDTSENIETAQACP